MLIKNPDFLIFLFGAITILFALLADILISSTVGMGGLQMAMLVIGSILSAFGLRRLALPEQHKWDWLLVAIYLSGILFTGLRPGSHLYFVNKVFLHMGRFNLQDFYINIIGFIPFGFLLMAALFVSVKLTRSIIITVTIAILVSTVIEYLQYCCIQGRYSSGYDLFSNVFAVILGVLIYIVYEWLQSFNRK